MKLKHFYNTILVWFVLVMIAPLFFLVTGKINMALNWRTASMKSALIAPNPANYKPAVVQVYAARTFSWRGLFAVHTWISVKPNGAQNYTVYQYIGWNSYFHKPCLTIKKGVPDFYWFGQKPRLLFNLRGEKATKAITEINAAVKHYPYRWKYHAWPGPNSNTFIAYIVRHSKALKFALPNNAIGKDFLTGWKVFGDTPSNTGYQFSLYNLLGVGFGVDEGFEANLLGFSLRLNSHKPFVHLPGVE